MFRKPVALLVALYAIVFAFLAMTVVRWPTLMTAVAMMFQEESADLSGFDWRSLGLQYGVPYLAAAIFFQISSFALATRQHGAVTAFVFGCATAFPCIFIFDMRNGWMAAPRIEEWVIVWIAGATLLVLGAVWDLRRRPDQEPINPERAKPVRAEELEWQGAGVPVSNPKAAFPAIVTTPEPAVPSSDAQPKRRKPVPPAIAIQRQRWAEEGRKARERQLKSRRKRS